MDIVPNIQVYQCIPLVYGHCSQHLSMSEYSISLRTLLPEFKYVKVPALHDPLLLRCGTLESFFVKGNIDSATQFCQHIGDRILDSL